MRSLGSIFLGDRVIWAIYFFLCAISLVEVFSAASTLAYESGNFWKPIGGHALHLLIGTIVVWITHRIPCRMFKIIPIFLLPISCILIFYVLLFGEEVNGAKRWMPLHGGLNFQPSELAKAAVVIAVALILMRMQREKGADKRAFKYILWVTVPVCVLIFPENLSTAVLLFGVVVLLMFVGRVPLIQIGKLFGTIILVVALFVGGVFFLKGIGTNVSEVPGLSRVDTWIGRFQSKVSTDDAADPDKFDIDKDAQIAHANIAIASSRGIGKMPGNSVERDFLSQAYSDFIYAIIIEELGIVGGTAVVFLYVVLLFRAGRIASRCERNFPAFLIIGLSLLLVSQAMANMLVAVGWLPVTGQPLPLISRGGTSTIINCWYIGMILSVSHYARQVKSEGNGSEPPVEEPPALQEVVVK